MAKTFFTPKRSDFCIGYEFETNYLEDDWTPKVMDEQDIGRFLEMYDADAYEHEFRVPYLTREQIEKEGLKFTYDFEKIIMDEIGFDKGKTSHFGPYRIVVVYGIHTKNLKIYIQTISGQKYVRFNGRCNDINTFRKIITILELTEQLQPEVLQPGSPSYMNSPNP